MLADHIDFYRSGGKDNPIVEIFNTDIGHVIVNSSVVMASVRCAFCGGGLRVTSSITDYTIDTSLLKKKKKSIKCPKCKQSTYITYISV